MATSAATTNSSSVNVKELIKIEYKKCALDPEYFITKYCYIQSNEGRCLFSLHPFQENALTQLEKYQFNIILKARQIGISTLTACYALWTMLFHKDKNILVIATKQATAKNLITKVRFAFDHLPAWLRIDTIEDNKLSLKLSNGSEIKAETATESSGRSDRSSILILDEAAHIKNAQDIWTSALPTIGQTGKVILISSPNGMGNFFHKTYSNALQHLDEGKTAGNDGTNIYFNPIKLDWSVFPGRDQKWRDQQTRLQGEQAAKQEHDAEFIGSGHTVIDAEFIEYLATLTKDPIYKMGMDGNVWVWKEPNYSHKYLICADCSRGDGEDYSACHVLDLDDMEQVAEYKGKISTTDYGHLLVELATKYNDAILAVEREAQGWAVIQTIIDRDYDNLFYMSKDLKYIDTEAQMNNRYYAEERKMVPGFTTTVRTRPLIINKLVEYMQLDPMTKERQIIINSIRTIEELRVFIWENGKAQSMNGYNDDLCISISFGMFIRDTSLRLFQEGIQLTKSVLSGIHRTGGTEAPVYSSRNLNTNPYLIQTGNVQNKEVLDLREFL